MTTPTGTEKLAQALREMIDYYRGNRTEEPYVMGRARAALEAHESRAQPAKPDGYAYRYADGFLRFNQGAPVNDGKPIEAIPFYFAPPPAQPASVADGWALTKLRDHEAACEACGRAVWDGKDEAHCIGFLAPCGRRVARLLDCGTVDCIKALAAAPQPAKESE